MAAKASTKRGMLPGYFESLQEKQSMERYLEKLKSIEGQDPYEISRKEWIDDVDCWPDVTYMNVGMYLLFAASPYELRSIHRRVDSGADRPVSARTPRGN